MALDFSILNPLGNSSIVGLSNTQTSTPAYIIPASTVGGTTPAPQTPAPSSIYSSAPSTVVKPAPQATGGTGGLSYTIKYGDTLGAIAARYGTSVSALAAANGITNPNLIVAGKTLTIPSAMGSTPPVGGGTGGAPETGGATDTLPAGQFRAPSGAIVDANGQIIKAAPVAGSPVAPDASAIAKAAGESGLSVSEYEQLLGGNTAVTSAEHDAIAKELGIPAAEAAAFAKPSQTTQEIYQQAYNNAGLDALHAKILTLIDSINAEKQQGTDAIGKVNENPFLDEKSRVGRGQRILDQVNSKISNDTSLLSELQNAYNSGVTQVNNLVAGTQNDFKTNQANAQAYLNYLQTKAQQQAENMKTDKTVTASNSVSDYLQGLTKAGAEAAASKAPTVIGSAASGYYRWDPSTQSFVQVTKPTGGSSSFTPTSAQKASVGQFLNSDAGKSLTGGVPVTSADLNAIFGDQTTFYSLLQQASDAGY